MILMIKRRKRRFGARRSLGSVVLTTATFLAFLGIVWQAYQSSVDDGNQKGSLPIIQAQSTPEKMRPVEEGGMRFANQNVSIFEQIEEPFAGDKRRVERLDFFKEIDEKNTPPQMAEMNDVSENFRVIPFARDVDAPDDSAPLPVIALPSDEDKTGTEVAQIETASGEEELVKSQGAATTASATTAVSVKEQQKENLATTLQNIVNSQVGEKETLNEDAEQVAMAKTVATDVQKRAVKKTPEAVQTIYLNNSASTIKETTEQAKKMMTGGYTIQLGSVRSEEGASQEWKKMQAKLPAVLSDLSMHVEKADLGARGVFYRIQAGQLVKEDADRICDEIKLSKVADCLVRKR